MTSTQNPTPRPPTNPWTLSLVHFRYGFLETVRVPIAVIGNMVFPALALLFFVVPQRAVAGDPVFATMAAGQLALFAVMSTCVFTYGVGVAEDRAQPFDPYVRTLPTGPSPRMVGRVLNGTAFSLLGLVPITIVTVLLTAARATFAQVLLGVVVLLAVSVPFVLIGLTIGYGLSSKAALAVAQVVVFPLAFAGGLFIPPETFPVWLDALSQATPSRAGRDLVVQALTGVDGSVWAVPVLLGWTAAFAALAVVVYRRDEGRRFR